MKKKLSCLLLVLTCLAFVPADKPLKVEGNFQIWNKHLTRMENIKQILRNKVTVQDNTFTPKEIEYIYATNDSLESFIVVQLQRQLADTAKK
jgi:hypothetical protein